MSKLKTLSEKIMELNNGTPLHLTTIRTEDVKEKIQNAERRLKEEIRETDFDLNESKVEFKEKEVKKIAKIFKEEFGDKLIK